MIRTFLFSAAALILTYPLKAQRRDKFTKIFQISLTPAVGTNGMHPGGFTNYFSLNLTSGYSTANLLLEAGLVSNLNTDETRGLQFAGIANITGANAFAGMQEREIDKKVREGFEANLSGAQFSGVANIVLNNVFGGQVSGGINLAKGALMGFQLAGISNTVYKYSFGVQLAGLYNVSAQSMDGVQVAAIFNITEGGLYGAQLSLFNRAGFTEGINTFPDNNYPTGIQIGLFNMAKKVNGFQIGLINYGRHMQGTQIGLINMFDGGKDPQTRDGTAIGLLNLGTSAYAAVYASDLFLTNFELGTGSEKDGRVTGESTEKHVLNSLIYSRDPGFLREREQWAIGYGLKKLFFNRSTFPGMNRFRFISFGIDLMHVNHVRKKLTRELSLLARPVVAVGSRLNPKNRNFFFFVSAAYNIYKSRSGKTIGSLLESGEGTSVQNWPGFAAGVMVR